MSDPHRPFTLGLLINSVPRNWTKTLPEGENPLSLDRYKRIAQTVDHAGFDLIFFADTVASKDRSARASLDPQILLSAISAVTTRIGLIASISTSFTEPFNLARQVASLDHVSNGRAGWNLVTSSDGGPNFGRENLPHEERYAKGKEAAEVVLALWKSWGQQALLADRHSGEYFDNSKVRAIHHSGEHFQVQGPLNVPRTPQGFPLIAQAGSSKTGQEVGAEFADLIFTTGLPSEDESRNIYNAIKQRARKFGRSDNAIRILPGVSPIIGSTVEEAERLWEDSIDESDAWRDAEHFAKYYSITLDELELDEPIPVDKLPRSSEVEGRRSRYEALLGLIQSGRIRTLRDLVRYTTTAAGHWFPIGTPEQIAEQFEQRYRSGAADGFNILGFFEEVPGGLDALTEGLVPQLKKRGLLSEPGETDSTRTLRQRLKLEERTLEGVG